MKTTLFINFFIPQSEKVRELWVADQLRKIQPGKKILDAGAGECDYRQYCEHLNYISQDLGKYDGKGDGKGIQTNSRDSSRIDIVSDIVNIPIKSGSFDAVLCVEVFEHLPRPLDALSELSRVLKKKRYTHSYCSTTITYSLFSLLFLFRIFREFLQGKPASIQIYPRGDVFIWKLF